MELLGSGKEYADVRMTWEDVNFLGPALVGAISLLMRSQSEVDQVAMRRLSTLLEELGEIAIKEPDYEERG